MNKIELFVQHRPKNTMKNYTSFLNQYFRIVDADVKTYFDNGRDYKEDVEKYWYSQLERPPLTRNARISCVKNFLEENEVAFEHKFWRRLKRRGKGTRAMTIDKKPTNEQLKKILLHGTVHDKAMFLIACSSGMRIAEILELKECDINMKSNPVMIRVRGETTKSGNPRITFISNEAKEYLEEWMKERENYIDVAIRKTGNLCKKDRKDGTIFPHGYNVAWMRWKSLITKAGFTERDPTTNRYLYHIHTLRKFFESKMAVAGVPKDVYEDMAGHEGYLSGSYRRIDEGELIDAYKKGVKSLLVFETTSDENIKRLDKESKKKDEQIQELKDQMQMLMAKVLTQHEVLSKDEKAKK